MLGRPMQGGALGAARPRAARGAMLDLAGELGNLPIRIGPGPWRGYEHVRGYGVYALPFSSGHVLALRVFPENDFAPYVTVWQRTPAGDWSIFYDAPRLDIACPRYYGPAARHVQRSRITLTWIGPLALQVDMDVPALRWTLALTTTPLLQGLNAVSACLPLSSWRSPMVRRMREWMARRLLGMGDIALAGATPSGHYGLLMPERVYFITESHAILDSVDMGAPIRAAENPWIGAVALPARPVFAVGQAFWVIKDQDEYRRTREEVRRVMERGSER